jgi:flagellar basal-body rod protein FlgF
MDNPGYVSLTRMRGLEDELRAVANNIANASTTGFRAEGVVFAEVLQAAAVDGGALAMAQPRAHMTDPSPGGVTLTGAKLDLAITGEGFFQVQTEAGNRLTRAGSFTLSPEGDLITMQGDAVLDPGGAPIAIPPDAMPVMIAEDGTISAADGQPLAEIGLFDANQTDLIREDGVRFRVDGPVQAAEEARVLQGYLEESNVDPVTELTRMIEVQRAYELGQSFLDLEDERMREAVRTLGRSS